MDRAYVDGLVASIDAEVAWDGEDGMRWAPPEPWDDNPLIPLGATWRHIPGLAGLSAQQQYALRRAAITGDDGWAILYGPGSYHWARNTVARLDGDQLARYTQATAPLAAAIDRMMKGVARALSDALPALQRLAAAFELHDGELVPTDPRERALYLRRTRNTGPADRRGLDGHHRRERSHR